MEAETEAYEAQAALHGIDLRKHRTAQPVSRQALEGMGFNVTRKIVKMETPHG